MIERKDLGSWMDGPPQDEEYVRGSAIGLPPEGPGSAAPFGRRVVSLLIDWSICSLVSVLLFSYDSLVTLCLFVGLNLALMTLFGATPGQYLLRLRTQPVVHRYPMLVRSLIRTALMLLVLPAVIWNRDRQPLHDVLAGTAVVRL
ncbi:RDD family protein [Brachybacterium hainanense]|uniref:RDD family protein n=1 Tax=Brachybacterium hainanense TaxID=1541174 RepID=A0ABV6RB82_9MICO